MNIKKYVMLFLLCICVAGAVACRGTEENKADNNDKKIVEVDEKTNSDYSENEKKEESETQPLYSKEDIEKLFVIDAGMKF